MMWAAQSMSDHMPELALAASAAQAAAIDLTGIFQLSLFREAI
jgi:hypothetical protein